jgi:8-oxo-dGTP diphosphatase
VCRKWCGELRGVEGQALAWVTPRELRDYPMPAADVPLVDPVLQAMEAGRSLAA